MAFLRSGSENGSQKIHKISSCKHSWSFLFPQPATRSFADNRAASCRVHGLAADFGNRRCVWRYFPIRLKSISCPRLFIFPCCVAWMWTVEFSFVICMTFIFGNRLCCIGRSMHWKYPSSSTFPGCLFYLISNKCCSLSYLLTSVKHMMLYLTSLSHRQASQVFQVSSTRWPKTTLSLSGDVCILSEWVTKGI